MGKPLISVVVCTYNREELLRGCLDSLCQQTLDKELYEVIVVDNNSTDNTWDIAVTYCKTEQNFRLVKELQQGLSHARNRGWIEANGQYIAYIDDDARATEDWLERIVVTFLTITPQPVAVGGKIHPWYDQTPPKWFLDDFEIRTWGDKPEFLQPPRAQYGFSGSNMCIRKEIIEAYSGFSPQFGMIGGKMGLGEESDLFMRIYNDQPCFWYDPNILVYHWVPKSNMTIKYRIQRAYKGGETIAYIDRGSRSKLLVIKTLAILIVQFIKLPFQFVFSNRPKKAELLYRIQALANSYGLLCGLIKK